MDRNDTIPRFLYTRNAGTTCDQVTGTGTTDVANLASIIRGMTILQECHVCYFADDRWITEVPILEVDDEFGDPIEKRIAAAEAEIIAGQARPAMAAELIKAASADE